MIYIGLLHQISGLENLSPVEIIGRPEEMPYLEEGQSLFCWYFQGTAQKLFICEGVQEARHLYDNVHVHRWADSIKWYIGDPGHIMVYKTPDTDYE